MEQLKAKLKKQGGFTMVELLIVVAIIAILVAVSIPMMNNALERSRHAVDQANVRDAIALVSVEYMSDPENFDSTKDYHYVVDSKTHQGYLDDSGGVAPQCQCGGKKTAALTVKLTPPTGTEKKPTVTTSWSFNSEATDGVGGKTEVTTTT